MQLSYKRRISVPAKYSIEKVIGDLIRIILWVGKTALNEKNSEKS